jgi:hypothetical protein
LGTVRIPPPVLFFASLIFRDQAQADQVERELSGVLGPISERTEVESFSQSDYYDEEMGAGLRRYFVLFTSLRDRGELAEIKLATNTIEQARADGGRRSVNIDPGYLALEQVVLATTKGYTHRIYLSKGIFADLTLVYTNGSYRKLEWTYPDYASSEVITFLNERREHYKRSLRCQKV